MARQRVVIVGAGVSGLSCAHVMLEAGHDVEVWTRDDPEQTTSTVAAAFWYPYRVDPPDRVAPWARASYERFAAIATKPEAGVQMREAIEVFPEPIEHAPWGDALSGFRRARPDELPAGRVDGFVFDAPVIETPVYIPWLVSRVRALGGRVERRTLRDLQPALDAAPIVVNASGLGARELVDDRDIYPVRGQIVMVKQPGLSRVTVDEHGPDGITYVVPRSGDCVLGGTSDDHATDTTVDAGTSKRILERCRRLDPALRDAPELGAKVGLRPCRHAVRVELEARADGGCIVHDYGHGGAGVTLSWGCAQNVLELVREHEAGARARLEGDGDVG